MLTVFLRELKASLLDQVRHRIELESRGIATEPECFEGDCTPTCKAIKNFGRSIRKCFREQPAQRIQPASVTRCFELGPGGKEVQNLLPTPIVCGIRKESTEDDCAAHCQWSTCPPEVHGGDVSMPQGLLARRRSIHCLQREFLFDQSTGAHERSPPAASITAWASAPKRTSRFVFQSPARAFAGFWTL